MDSDYNKFSSAPFIRANNEIFDVEETPFHKRHKMNVGSSHTYAQPHGQRETTEWEDVLVKKGIIEEVCVCVGVCYFCSV